MPLHFLVLGLAIRGAAPLDRMLSWSTNPLVKLMEMVLVFLLGVHMLGGIRVLAIENLAWSGAQKQAASAVLLVAGLMALFFIIRAA